MKTTRLHDPFLFTLHPTLTLWEAENDFCYHVGTAKSDETVIVPAGFITDFASIPRPVRWVFPNNEIVALPPLVHDWLYASHIRPKNEADDIFYEAMIAAGYDGPRAWMQYQAVKIAGGKAYSEIAPRNFQARTPELYDKYYEG